MRVSRSLSPRTATIVLTFTCAATANAGLSGTTTTTLPLGSPVAGKKLLLKENTAKPQKRRLLVLLKDAAIDVPNGSANDPVTAGGSLRIRSSAGGFSEDYDLPATGWRYKGKQGKNKGYLFKGAGPIVKIVLENGKLAKVVGKGAALVQALAVDPDPVHVALTIGGTTYCASFAGKKKFAPGKRYLAKNPPVAGACAAFETQCGDGILDPGEACPQLEGPSDGLAVDATFDYQAGIPIPPEANDVDATGAPLIRSRIEVVFLESATVGEVNALLTDLGGRISSMLAGIRSIVVDLPDPGSVSALDAVVAQVEAAPFVEMVLEAYEPHQMALPDNYTAPLDATNGARIDHHLAVRAAAAWNARGAIQRQPTPVTVAVLDYFGDGAPDAALDAVVPATDFATGMPEEHGYHVAGIIAGRFGGDATTRGQVTGMLPATAEMRAVDITETTTSLLDELNLVIEALDAGEPHGVLNTSLGYACNHDFNATVHDAHWWTYKVRQRGLESRALLVGAAGNIDSNCPAETAADVASRFNAAALVPLPVANLTNVLVVENASNDAGPAFAPMCLWQRSMIGGDVAGIGRNVWSFLRAASGAGDKTGTSMATPQVAGLAAYAWSIAPAMWVQDLRNLLVTTGRSLPGSGGQANCSAADPAPVIDAYAVVLALDAAALPTPGDAPVRLALLDVDDDGDFDDDDLFEWTTILIDATTGELQEPIDPEYQRYDLNGDGYTGGAARTGEFDLDRVGSTRYGSSMISTVMQTIEGGEVTFDETALTDLDILCYYAYSDLFTGSSFERTSLLGSDHCSPIVLNVDFPSGVLLEGQSATLTVALGTNDPGGSQPLAGETIQLLPTGATADPASGLTDAQGMFSSSITAGSGVTSLQVVVRAVSTADGTPLGERTVMAPVQPNVPGTVAWRTSTCIFSQSVIGQLTSTNLLNVCDGGPVDGRHALPYVDSGTCTGAIAQPGVGSVTAASTGTIDSDWLTDAGGGRVGVRLAGHSSPTVELVVMQPGNVAPCGGAGGRIFCGVEFDVQNGVAPYAITYETSGAVSGNGETRLLVSLGGSPDSGPPVALVNTEIGVDERTGTLLPGSYGLTIESRVDVGTCDASATASGMASVTAQLVLGTSTPTTTLVTTTTSTTTSTSTTTTTATSSSTTSVSVTTTTSSTTSTSTTLFAVPVVPYARYVATGPDGPVVMLADEFGTESVDLGAVGFELPPVTVDGLLPPDPDTHQTCWTHPGGLVDTCIDVQDQFGLAPLRVGDPVAVCVPDLSPAIAVDAFKCYQATGTPLDQPVALEDEFQTQAVVVGAPELLCTPVEVDGSPITNAGRYLVCYATTPAGAAGGQISVENAVSGGPIQVDLGAATGVCVPALRQLVATCQLCGNGVPEGDEECDDGNVVAGDGCSPVCRLEP